MLHVTKISTRLLCLAIVAMLTMVACDSVNDDTTSVEPAQSEVVVENTAEDSAEVERSFEHENPETRLQSNGQIEANSESVAADRSFAHENPEMRFSNPAADDASASEPRSILHENPELRFAPSSE